jgi:hypothetical protein
MPTGKATQLQEGSTGMAQFQDYFNFLAPDDIRIKGTRIGY